jgi:DNA/RNA endonuclease YhcR with UshA esterase domain
MKIYKTILGMIAAALLTIGPAVAQSGGNNGNKAPRYDPATEITVTGTVQDIQQHTRGNGWGGTHLALKTKSGMLDVHLGPTRFLAKQDLTIAKGDQLEVTGSKIPYDGGEAVVARVVKKGDRTLTLRDSAGFPMWSHGRRP